MRLHLYIILCIVLISCKSEKDISTKINYFPFHINGEWKYRSKLGDEIVLSVISQVKINNTFALKICESKSQTTGFNSNIEWYYAKNNQGDLIRLCKPANKEVSDTTNRFYLWFKFSASAGESWLTKSIDPADKNMIDQYRITLLSKSDTVHVMGKIFTNCYKYYIEDLNLWDWEYYEWVSKDVGIIKRKYKFANIDYYLIDYK